MQSNKITIVTMLLTTFLLAVPFTPVHATTATVSVSLDNPTQVPGGAIVATVSVSPISMLQGYDIQLQFNPDVLTVQSATFASTLGSPTFSSKDLFQAGGSVHMFIFRTDGGSVSPSSTSPLLNVNFKVNGGSNPAIPPAKSLSELPSTVGIFSAELGLADGSTVFPSTVDASYNAPTSFFTPYIDVRPQTFICTSKPTTLNADARGHGSSVLLRCSIINNSTSITVQAGAHFTWTSLRGITGSAGAVPQLFAPGQTGELDATMSVPPTADIFTISAAVGYGFADGGVFQSSGTITFQLIVQTPTSKA